MSVAMLGSGCSDLGPAGGDGREARGRKEGYLSLAPIPTFRVVMIRKRGQGRGVKKVEGWADTFIICPSFSVSGSQHLQFCYPNCYPNIKIGVAKSANPLF